MTLGEQIKKATTWININSLALTVFSGCLVSFAVIQVKMYKAILLQPTVDAKQLDRIELLQKSTEMLYMKIERNEKKIERNEKKIEVINAIIPATRIPDLK